jgi:Family of unknown function (DUF5990)
MRAVSTAAPTKTSLTVEIHGTDLPGRRCGPSPEGRMFEDIYVGIRYRADTRDLVPGDAPSASWEFEVTVRRDEDGAFDFTGPYVYGRRGERSVGLAWGTLTWDDDFDVFRAAKLRMADIDPAVVERALARNGRLVARLGLTDDQGHPRCASVRPPDVVWSAVGGRSRRARA